MTTNGMMTLRAVLEKNSDADLLRVMIGFTADASGRPARARSS